MNDHERFARRNSVVYRCLTPDPAQALLFGNGRVGGSVHTPDDSLYLLISRSDIWNEQAAMGSIAAVRVRGNQGLFAGAKSVRQECNLYEASILIALQTGDGEVMFTITCLRNHDVIQLAINDGRSRKEAFTVEIENWHAGDQTESNSSFGIETIHVNRTSCFEQSNLQVNVDAAALGISDPILGRAWGLFVSHAYLPPATKHTAAIATVCLAPPCQEDPICTVRGQGCDLITHAGMQWEEWLGDHRQWWADFWSRSYVALESGSGDAEYEERLWYVNLYLIACACGGSYPPRFNGATFLLDKDTRDWDYGYWFQNMREIYWPLLAAGHWPWMRDFFQMYFDALPFVKAQTTALFGVDSPSYRETQSFWGWAPGTNINDSRFNAHIHHNFSSNLEVCLLMDWYARASGDEDFREKKFHPFLKEIISFFLCYATEGDDGLHHIVPSNALEVWQKTKDPMPDIAGLHYLLPLLIENGIRYGECEEHIQEWRNFLERLAPIPIGHWTISRKFSTGIHNEEWLLASELSPCGMFLPAADKTGEKLQRRNMENAELYLVFPWGLIGKSSSVVEQRRFENTWHHRTWKFVNNGWAQDVPQLARMGWAEEARRISLEHASYSQRFPNGSFISPGVPHFHGLLTPTPYFDTAGVHLMGINEMLLQSYDGIIRIAPAVTAEWSGSFHLHTLDGFEVRATFAHGKPVCASISPRPGRNIQRMRILNERTEIMEVHLAGEMHCIEKNALFEGDAIPNVSAKITWNAVDPGSVYAEQTRPDVIYPGFKIRPPWTCHPTGHWHDERKDHGQVGLAEDGLFPATRRPMTSLK